MIANIIATSHPIALYLYLVISINLPGLAIRLSSLLQI